MMLKQRPQFSLKKPHHLNLSYNLQIDNKPVKQVKDIKYLDIHFQTPAS